MKYVNALAFVAALGCTVACSDSTGDTDGGAGATNTGGTNSGVGGTNSGVGGTNDGTGGADTGSGGTGTGTGGGNGSAWLAECPAQTYTPATNPAGVCATSTAPTVPQIADFETSALGWGVYANNGTGPTTVPETYADGDVELSAGGPDGSTQAIHYAGSGFAEGLRFNVGYGATCQNVKAFSGVSFWAQGTVAAATAPYAVDANTVIVKLGSQKTLPTDANGDCTEDCYAHPDYRVVISTEWKEYQIPFDCFGQGDVFDGHLLSMLFEIRGESFDVSIDQVAYY